MRASVARVGLGDPGGRAPGFVCETGSSMTDSKHLTRRCVETVMRASFSSSTIMYVSHRSALFLLLFRETKSSKERSFVPCHSGIPPRGVKLKCKWAIKSRDQGDREQGGLRARLHCVSQSDGIPHSSTSWHSIALTSVSPLALGAPTGKPSLRAAAATQEARRPVSTSWTKRATGKPSTFW